MKKILLTLFGVIVVLGVLAGAGFVGYRIGFNQAARAFAVKKATATTQLPPPTNGTVPRGPMQNFNQGFGPRNMPMFRNFGNNFGRGFNRGMGPGGFGMLGRGRGFGFFAPFQFLIHVAIWGLVIWVIYLAIRGSGWRLTRESAQSAPVAAPVVEPKPEQPE